MKENLKNKIILALGILIVIFFISSIGSYQEVVKQKKLVSQERDERMELEKRIVSLSDLRADSEQKIKQLQESLNQEKANYQEAMGGLNQEISELKQQLETVTKLKERLEEDLGQALISQDK